MDGTEDASGLDQLHQFGVAGEKPLQAVGARQCRTKGERGTVSGDNCLTLYDSNVTINVTFKL